MKLFIYPDPTDVTREAARLVAEALRAKPNLVLGLPTGDTPLKMYAELKDLDFSQARCFNLDEYVGLPEDHPASYHTYMRENLPRAQSQVPDGNAPDLEQACRDYETAILNAGGLDLVVLGLGLDGHIAFNEPPSSLASRTRPVRLASSTRRANANHFAADQALPQMALTMGVGTILEARAILLLATGAGKADILARAVEGPLAAMVPATALQMHPQTTILCDEAAAARLELLPYYREAFPVATGMNGP